MTFDVFIRPEAQQDIEHIALWYHKQAKEANDDLDKRFLDTMGNTLDKLSRLGDSFAVVYKNTRKVLLPKFPYAIYYVIDNNALIVFAILHTSRNPITWQQKADSLLNYNL